MMRHPVDRGLRRFNLEVMVRRAFHILVDVWKMDLRVSGSSYENGVRTVRYRTPREVQAVLKINAKNHCRGCSCWMCKRENHKMRDKRYLAEFSFEEEC